MSRLSENFEIVMVFMPPEQQALFWEAVKIIIAAEVSFEGFSAEGENDGKRIWRNHGGGSDGVGAERPEPASRLSIVR